MIVNIKYKVLWGEVKYGGEIYNKFIKQTDKPLLIYQWFELLGINKNIKQLTEEDIINIHNRAIELLYNTDKTYTGTLADYRLDSEYNEFADSILKLYNEDFQYNL